MKKRKPNSPPKAQAAADDKPATLKELLNPDVVNKLKAHADSMRAEEAQRAEAVRQAAEDARNAEKKRLENDFEHQLNLSSADWRKYK